ncbi:MAG: BamA/TamA family outer membrane protein [Myxococcales bacterium]|nr:BamA/TamA family outer membrane protein [Myxococcales bacterium]
MPRHPHSRYLAALAALLAACATTRSAEEPEAEGPIIDRVRIEGAKQLSEAELKKHILTAESGWLPFSEPHRFDANAWQADLRRLERYYQAQGYYQAKVLEDEVDLSREGHVSLRVRLEEGSPTLLSKVSLLGLEELPPEHRGAVLAASKLRPGEVFEEENWGAAKAAIRSRLRELGYAEAVVEGEATVDVATRKAEVHLEVRPGLRYRFGRIFVATAPNPKVSSARIQEQASEAIKTGEVYSEAALADAQARVFAMGVFGAVKVNRGAPDRQMGTVPVVVDVREAPFHTERLGGGVGVDQTRQEARLVGEYTHRNFFGGLRRYTLRGKVGYSFLPGAVSVFRGDDESKHGASFQLVNEFEQPRLFLPTLSFRSSLELTRGMEPAYDFWGGSLTFGVVWRPRTDLAVFPSFNLDAYRLSTPVPLGGTSKEELFGCELDCVLSYFEQTIELDRRDDKYEPRSGYYLALSLQEGGGPNLPFYLRLLPEARAYLSFGSEKQVTLGGKLKLGTLLTDRPQPTPIVARFFSGGGSSMRGFNTRRLSPLRTTEGGTNLPVGGDGLFESSVELRYNFAGDWVLAAFLDSGFVTSQSFGFGDPGYVPQNLLFAVGLGLRYRTPLGPIRLDLARRLPVGPPLEVNPPPAEKLPGRCFTSGIWGADPGYAGSPEDLCSFHVSIGEAF